MYCWLVRLKISLRVVYGVHEPLGSGTSRCVFPPVVSTPIWVRSRTGRGMSRRRGLATLGPWSKGRSALPLVGPQAWTELVTASCNEGFADMAPVGRYKPKAFGFHDMTGDVWEWLADCHERSYANVPRDGSALARRQLHRVQHPWRLLALRPSESAVRRPERRSAGHTLRRHWSARRLRSDAVTERAGLTLARIRGSAARRTRPVSRFLLGVGR